MHAPINLQAYVCSIVYIYDYCVVGHMDILSCTNTSGKCSMNISGQHYD